MRRTSCLAEMLLFHGAMAMPWSNRVKSTRMRSLMFIDHINEATCVLFQCQPRVFVYMHV